MTAILIGISANSDNLAVGISYGIKRRYIGWWQNGVVAVVTTGITLCALSAGHTLRHYLFPDLPSWISGGLLILLALWSSCRYPKLKRAAIIGNQDAMTLAEALYLSLVLSVNNIGLAVAGGLGDLGYGAVTASVFIFSVIVLAAGQQLGRQLGEKTEILGTFISGNAVLFLAGVAMLAGF